MIPSSDAPVAVLLDAGGVFVLPDPDRILGAFTRAACSVPRQVLADAHYYRAAARFGIHSAWIWPRRIAAPATLAASLDSSHRESEEVVLDGVDEAVGDQ